MKVGLGSYTFAWACGVPGQAPERPMTDMDLLERAAELGAEVVQLCENVPYPESAWPALRARADELGLEIEVGTRGLMGGNLRKSLAAAKALRSSLVRVVMDSAGHEPSPEEAVALIRADLPAFADAGIVLALENHDRFPAAVLRQMVEELGPERVGVTLDTVNSFGALEGPEVVIAALAPYTRCLHVKDFTIRRVPSMMGFVIEGCAVGQGRLDVPALLRQIPPAANAIVELWTPFGPDLAATLAREAAWASESVPTLRRLVAASHRAH